MQMMTKQKENFIQSVVPCLPQNLQSKVQAVPNIIGAKVQEIQLRGERPVILSGDKKEWFLAKNGGITPFEHDAYVSSAPEIQHTLESLCQYSLFSIEEQIKKGYFTISNGCRIGIVGRVVMQDHQIRHITDITGINIRLARQVMDVANPIMPYIDDTESERIHHTLILSPPGMGKTTLLRDVARQVSNGFLGHRGVKVAIVDERSEIAACNRGVSQYDVGIRTDVLDGCPKADGMLMVIRSMSPKVIITDEIGRQEDYTAVMEAVHCGVSVVASAHSSSLDEIIGRPVFKALIKDKVFTRYILLGKSLGVGTIENILEGNTLIPLIDEPIRHGGRAT